MAESRLIQFTGSTPGSLEIYTDTHPDPARAAPEKKPYIIFKLDTRNKNDKELYKELIKKNHYEDQGTMFTEGHYNILTITSARKVAYVINDLLEKIKKNSKAFETTDNNNNALVESL